MSDVTLSATLVIADFGTEAAFNSLRIAARRGDLAAARTHAEEAVAIATEEHGRIDEGIARKILGAVLSRAGVAAREHATAAGLLEGADLAEHAHVLAEQARAAARRGDRGRRRPPARRGAPRLRAA